MITYILKTDNGEYYCGKTNNISRRLREHRMAKGKWFIYKERHKFKLTLSIEGDYEKEVKRFGVKKFAKAASQISLS